MAEQKVTSKSCLFSSVKPISGIVKRFCSQNREMEQTFTFEILEGEKIHF